MSIGNNPILRGFHPDPCMIRVGSDYYLATSTFQWFGGVELYHSKDLINWECLPSPLNRLSQLNLQGVPNSGGIWAPCLSYCDGTFYLVYTIVKNFQGIFKDTHNYLVTTTDIYGEWSEPTYLNSSGFDPSLFHDQDGRKYLLNMRWDHRMENHPFEGILLQEYSVVEKRLIGQPINIYKGTEIGITEGPHLYTKDGLYYLMVAEGGTGFNHGVRIAKSNNIYGPYESDNNPLITTRNNPEYPLQRVGHASLIDTEDGRWYISFLCGRPISQKRRTVLGRETGLAEVTWIDGWLRLKDGGVLPPLDYSTPFNSNLIVKNDEKCEFHDSVLPSYFKTLRLPFEKMGSLQEKPGYLRLYGHEAITSLNNQSLVARRLDCFNAEVTTKLIFNPSNFQQMAGLTVFYDTFNFFYLYLSSNENDGNELRLLVRNNLKFTEPLKQVIFVGKVTNIYLKIKVCGTKLQFYYSLTGVKFIEIGEELDYTSLADEAYSEIDHEGHTGTFVGMACQDLSGNNLFADFEFFDYQRN